MHLHGFHFRVDGRGDGVRDTVYAPADRRLAVTETLLRGQTMTISWSPVRPGNWLFHCHIAAHMIPQMDIDEHGDLRAHAVPASNDGAGGHAEHQMAQLVLGIHVRPNGVQPVTTTADERAIRLLVRSRPARGATNVRYAYVLGGSAEESDPAALPAPGPTLILEKKPARRGHHHQFGARAGGRALARHRVGELAGWRPRLEWNGEHAAPRYSAGRLTHRAVHAAPCGHLHVSLALQ